MLREPLLHFFLAAAAIFLVEMTLRPTPAPEPGEREIVVSREALLTFIQYRTKQFDQSSAAKTLAGLSPKDRKRLIDDFVREEALYREAKALGLGQSDYVIRRRMVQKLDFITRSFSEAQIDVSSQQIEAHYQTHLSDYRMPATISFTHVFFSDAGAASDHALRKAKAALSSLQGQPFEAAPRHGDLFPYGVNFVDRPREQIESLFGAKMTAALFALPPQKGAWRGPVLSQHGAHLVMVIARKPARVPPLSEVRKVVEAEARVEEIESRRRAAADRIVEGYRIRVEPSLTSASGAQPR